MGIFSVRARIWSPFNESKSIEVELVVEYRYYIYSYPIKAFRISWDKAYENC